MTKPKNLVATLAALMSAFLLGCAVETEGDAERHLDQAFSFLASLEVATEPETRTLLLRNAEVELSKALEIEPENILALMNRGVVNVSMGRLNIAELDYDRALEIEPSNAELNYNLTCLYALTGREDLALDALDTALSNGFDNIGRLREDPDLSAIRGSDEFKNILEKNRFFL